MSRSPQDVYARYLLSSRGYPLWIPEPSQELLLTRPDGLRIGDVGVVVPEDGGFEVFFNICLPREHPFHRSTGVPDNFDFVELHDNDIRIIPRVENPGRIISTSSVTNIRTLEGQNDVTGTHSGGPGYEFDLSSSGGALLILPEGAERYDLRNHHLFFEEAIRHGVGWYHFAEERLGRMISHDSLYLITGFYKTRSWSLAAFENISGSGQFSAQFKMAQGGGSNIAATYTWETSRSLDWRAGPEENYGFANQSVFIRGFKVALRAGFLGKKRIEVKVDAPSTSSQHGRFSYTVKRDTGVSDTWMGLSRGSHGKDTRDDEVITGSIADGTGDDFPSHGVPVAEGKYVVVHPMPALLEMFHPSDVINQYLLDKEASANIAITHDDDWITLLEKGQLKPEDFIRANSLQMEATVGNNFHVVSQKGVVFLQGKSDPTKNSPITAPALRTLEEWVEEFSPNSDEDAPPAYGTENPGSHGPTNVSEKPCLPESLISAIKQSSGVHWLLLPYNPRASKHLLRFDIMFPAHRICYQYNNVRERLLDKDLDEPAVDEPITKMRIAFEQRPFNWTIYVDNPKGIRCRDVFEAIYDSFNQQLTLGELWLVPDRAACEEAFRIRNLVLGIPQKEQSLGWKRVDVLLHHTIFHGLTMNSEGDWVLNLGAPLPVPDIPHAPPLSRRNSSSTEENEECDENSEEYLLSSSPMCDYRARGAATEHSAPRLSSRVIAPTSYLRFETGDTESGAPHTSPLFITPTAHLERLFEQSRRRRPLGPRPRRTRSDNGETTEAPVQTRLQS